jgi:hypothetical protein
LLNNQPRTFNGVGLSIAKEALMSSKTPTESRTSQLTNMKSGGDLQQIREALRKMRFGSVKVFVQDGVVVQVERTVKTRLQRPHVAAHGNCSR